MSSTDVKITIIKDRLSATEIVDRLRMDIDDLAEFFGVDNVVDICYTLIVDAIDIGIFDDVLETELDYD